MKKLIFTLTAIGLILAGTEAKSAEGWIKVYLGDADRNQIGASGSCTIIATTKAGERMTLKAKLVTPDESNSDGKLAYGGQVIVQGKNSVELVVGKPEHVHGSAKGGHQEGTSEAEEHHEVEEHHEAEEHEEVDAHEHGEENHGSKVFPYFEANFDFAGDNIAFSAVVIIKTDKSTFNVKGFEYPFLDYGSVVSTMQAHLDEIQSLIDSDNLLKVHPAASKISLLAESLPNAKDFPDDSRAEVEKTCKEIIALFGEIDKAGDSQNKTATIEVLGKYRSKVSFLAKHIHKDEDHKDDDH